MCYIREKSKNRYFKMFSHMVAVIMKKQKTLQLLIITKNTRNKQTIKEKD